MPPRRIAITGGPAGGKTTIWRVLTADLSPRVRGVPEVATLMLAHVFPGVDDEVERRALQDSILQVQQSLETVHAQRAAEGQILLCDRGTPDGAGYWPDGHEAFFRVMGLDWQRELERYDAVLFMQTAARAGQSVRQGNDARLEDHDEALEVDRRLHDVWSAHPRFHHVPAQADFAAKLEAARAVLLALLGE